jgi:sec-independent protein translocase protein TatB
MFDIGWSELLVVAVVMILVVGPKDLPGMLRAFGKTMSQVRSTANDFRRQFNDALRDAENEAGLKDAGDQLNSIGSVNPMAEVTKGLNDLKRGVTEIGDTDEADTGEVSPSTPSEQASADEKSEPEPLKKSGSDAA